MLSEEEKNFVNGLFVKISAKMYNISYNMINSKHDAEEAVSQTFLKIIENVEKISNFTERTGFVGPYWW